MHIILVSDRLATAKTITITKRHMALAVVALFATVIGLSSLFSYVTVRHAAEIRLPFLQDLLRIVSAEESRSRREVVQENLNAMAVKLGEMQAQLLRLDSMGERLAGLAGIKPQEIKALAKDGGRGGPLVPAQPMSPAALQEALNALAHEVEVKSDSLAVLESELLGERIRKSLLPTTLPVDTGWNASSFGWRSDPFTGESAMHEGVDFTAEAGTPIKAAAAGIVVTAERHPQYGNMIEIDHGNDLVTRYAHASKVFTKVGALVKRGEKVAEVGSTGRSTGPHLHFEVRIKGAPLNPNRFLQLAQRNGSAPAHRH